MREIFSHIKEKNRRLADARQDFLTQRCGKRSAYTAVEPVNTGSKMHDKRMNE